MLGRKIARHSVVIIGTALLGGLLSATMVRLAPGFDTDEAQIDSHLNSESLRALRESRSQQQHFCVLSPVFEAGFPGGFGFVAHIASAREQVASRTGAPDSPPDRRCVALELGGGYDIGAQRRVSAPV
jgi:hypothetical protein